MGNCCSKPLFRIIKIGGIEVGIKGLDQAFEEVRLMNEKEPDKIKSLLILKIKEYGNYISHKREIIYKEDLYKKYELYCKSLNQLEEIQKAPRNKNQKRQWLFLKR